MALYERLCGRTDAGVVVEGKIPIHPFSALMRLFAQGTITGQEAQSAVASMSSNDLGEPMPLTSPEVAEAQTLLGTITSITNANQTTQRLLKIERAHVIDDMLMLGEIGAEGFATPTEVKTKLGV